MFELDSRRKVSMLKIDAWWGAVTVGKSGRRSARVSDLEEHECCSRLRFACKWDQGLSARALIELGRC